jgi:hypothetical protein
LGLPNLALPLALGTFAGLLHWGLALIHGIKCLTTGRAT